VITQKIQYWPILFILIILLLILCIFIPVAILGAIALSIVGLSANKSFIPLALFISLLLILHGNFYFIVLAVIVAYLLFNLVKWIYRAMPF